AARAHGDLVSDRHDRIGHVAPMQHAGDQAPDSRLRAIPADGYRKPAHIRNRPTNATPLTVAECACDRLLYLTLGCRRLRQSRQLSYESASSNLKPTFCRPSSAPLPYSVSISFASDGA